MLLRAGIGWKEGLVGHVTVGAELDSQAGYTLHSSEPVIVEDIRTEKRFSGPPLLHEHNVVSGMSVIIQGQKGPWGVLGTHTAQQTSYSKDDINFIQAVANILADVIARKQTDEVIKESENKYRSLFDNMLNCFAYCKIIVDENNKPIDFVYLEVNDAFERLTGLKKDYIIGKKVTEAIPTIKGKNPELFDIYGKVALTGEGTQFEIHFEPLEMWFYISVYSPQKEYFVAVFDDITERKKAEKIHLEQKKALEQKNIALNEILGQIEIEKKQIKDNVIANAENLLLPIIQKLRLKGESHKYVQLLQKNVQELTSSFGARLTEKRARLTTREIEICNMIKNGLTNKEISRLLNISLGTTEKHRNNIRKKLHIVNKDINLSSFLNTL